MSNATTTFRLQSYGTSSAFDPNIIDFSRDTINGGGNNGNKQFITNEIFNIETNTGFLISSIHSYYFAIKPQHNVSTFSELILPCLLLPATAGKNFGISVGFFEYKPTSCVAQVELGTLVPIVLPFTLTGSIPPDFSACTTGTITFPINVEVPVSKYTTYIGIKLVEVDPTYPAPSLTVESFTSNVSFADVLGFTTSPNLQSSTSTLIYENLNYAEVPPVVINTTGGELPVIWIN